MKVIVCGAGQVGSNIARHLAAEGNDVTVIDRSPDLVRKISDMFDVHGMVGFASHPDMLERAGAADCDMLIAVTLYDEINMVACQVAHSLFNVPMKIARVRSQKYLTPRWANLFSRDHMPIDVIISPEIEVAQAVNRALHVPGATEMIPFAEDRVRLIGVRIDEDCSVINTPLRQLTELFPSLTIYVTGITRGNSLIVPTKDDQMLPGDEVYLIVDTAHVPRVMPLFSSDNKEARRIIIVGGGNIGLFLSAQLEQEDSSAIVKVIESSRERAELIAEQLNKSVILNGDALDAEILAEANVRRADAIVTLTNDDEVNILAALMAKQQGCEKAIALVNNQGYGSLIASLGLDVVVNPRATTVSSILQHVRRGRIRRVHSLRDGAAEVIEAEALETSSMVGVSLTDLDLPAGILIGAIVRDNQVMRPYGDTVIQKHDRVIIFAQRNQVRTVEKLLSVRLEFF